MRHNLRCFTLLEIMIVLALLAIVAPVIGFRVYSALEKSRFDTAAQRVHFELDSYRHLALNMQADWSVSFAKIGGGIALSALCPEVNQSRSSHWEAPFDLFWNSQPTESVSFHFTSTGRVLPSGVLELKGKKARIQWKIPEFFSISEGKGNRLPRPDLEKS